MIEALQMKYGSAVAITASTGIAACNINGCTLHSFSGIGIGKGRVENLIENMKLRNKRAVDRWTSTQVLIIDEGKSLYINGFFILFLF
jgi:ATP-dependent DNA helicase PIF1